MTTFQVQYIIDTNYDRITSANCTQLADGYQAGHRTDRDALVYQVALSKLSVILAANGLTFSDVNLATTSLGTMTAGRAFQITATTKA